MKKIITLFSFLILFSCEEEKSSDSADNSAQAKSCDQLEAIMWAEYNKLAGERNSGGVTQTTCSSTKAAIEDVRPCSAGDPDFATDLNNTSTQVNSWCG